MPELQAKEILITVLAFFTAGAAAFAFSPLAGRLAKLIGAVDVPKDGRRMHDKPMTRLGGLAIFAGFAVAVFIFDDFDRTVSSMLIGAVIIVTLGVMDDILTLNAWVKLAGQIAAALVPTLYGGLAVERFSNFFRVFNPAWPEYINLGALSVPITVVWIVVITNSVNLIDGLDGLACGVSSIAALSILLIAVALGNAELAVVTAALAGGCLGFLPYNSAPAKMFMGDTGALFLGYVLSVASIMGLFKFYALVTFAVPFIILGLPVFDTISAITRRLARGKSPMAADRSHIHHSLTDMGFSQKQTVTILYIVSAVMGVTGVIMAVSGEGRVFLLLIAALAAFISGIKIGTKREPPAPKAGDKPDVEQLTFIEEEK